MRDFWFSSGRHLTHRLPGGGLAVSDALLHGFLSRPELVPPGSACLPERALHGRLLADPRVPVAPVEIARLRDGDARANWTTMLALRDRLLAAGSVEAAFRDLSGGSGTPVPAALAAQLAHLVARNALDDCADPFVLRAGEILFRPQRLAVAGGQVLLTDADVPGSRADLLDEDNAWTYWSHSDAFATTLDIGPGSRGLDGFARALEAWLATLLGVHAVLKPLKAVPDKAWRSALGLDAASAALCRSGGRGDGTTVAVLALQIEPGGAVPDRAPPSCLMLAAGPDGTVRMEPGRLSARLARTLAAA